MDLALSAGVSTRHLSYVETSKAQPSAMLIEQLAEALAIPLRDRNALLVAAGYAPRYRETSMEADEFARSRQAVDLILEHQRPYPAFLMDRHWDALMVNPPMTVVLALLGRPQPRHRNVILQVFDPEDLRPLISNWDELATDLVHHLHQDIALMPKDSRLRELFDQVFSFPGVPDAWRKRDVQVRPLPIMTTRFRAPGGDICFFSTLTTLAAARDVTLSELRIECMYPADEATKRFCRELDGET